MKRKTNELKRRTMDEARRDRAGPYVYQERERTDEELLHEWTPQEILDHAERDVLTRLEAMGYTAFFVGDSLSFEGIGGGSPDPDNARHTVRFGMRMAFEIRAARRCLEAEGVTPGLCSRMYALGRDVETWRIMPYNRSARTDIRRQANKAATDAKKRQKREAIFREMLELEQHQRDKGETRKAIGKALDLGIKRLGKSWSRKRLATGYREWKKGK